jgi:ATP-binding cassette subfamily B protein
VGHLTAFYAYVVLLSGPVRWLGMSLSMAQRAVASGNRMFEILDREPSMESAPDAPALPEGHGQVSLQRVTLRYDGAEPTLTGIDLEVDPGRTVALVGPTASGKTSLVGLLARLYDPSEGRCSSTAPTCARSTHSLRSSIAFVADDSFLFSATVGDNIAYARPEATGRRSSAPRGGTGA